MWVMGKPNPKKQEGEDIKFKEAERKRIFQTLEDKLKAFKKHRERNYDSKWDKWSRMVKGEYKYSKRWDEKTETGNDSWKNRVYYKIANQKRLSALAQIRDAKPNGDKLPLDLTAPSQNKNDSQVGDDVQEAIKALGVDSDFMLDKHRRVLDDHLTFSNSNQQFNYVIDDASKFGAGAFIAPYVYNDYSFEYEMNIKGEPPALENEGGKLTPNGEQAMSQWVKDNVFPTRKIKKEMRVGIKHIPLRDFYPDPACLGNGQKGMGHFIREHLSVKSIMQEVEAGRFDKDVALELLKKYDDVDNINGFNNQADTSEHATSSSSVNRDVFKGVAVYTYYGDILAKDYKVLSNSETTEKQLSDYAVKSVKIMIAEGTGILFAMANPYPTQQRAIHIVQWEEMEDEWCGRGIPEKIEGLQQALNTVINVWLDQSELVGAGMLGVNIKDIDEDEDMELYPNKIFYLKGDKPVRDILQQFNIQDASPALIGTISQILFLIDHESGVPKIIEGQGDVNAKTAYETQQQETHALKQLGMVIDNLDKGLALAGEMINEHIIIYEAENHDFFGDYRVIARGYSTFEKKRVKIAELDGAINAYLTQEPARNIINGAEVIRERFRLMSPENLEFVYTDKEIAQNVANQQAQQQAMLEQQQQLEAKKVEGMMAVENLRGQNRLKEKQMDGMIKAQLDDVKTEHQSKLQDKKEQLEREKLAVDIEERQEDRVIKQLDGIRERNLKAPTPSGSRGGKKGG